MATKAEFERTQEKSGTWGTPDVPATRERSVLRLLSGR